MGYRIRSRPMVVCFLSAEEKKVLRMVLDSKESINRNRLVRLSSQKFVSILELARIIAYEDIEVDKERRKRMASGVLFNRVLSSSREWSIGAQKSY